MYAVLEPFFRDSVCSREIEIRSKHKGDVVCHMLSIQQRADAADASRGAALFYGARNRSQQRGRYVDANGLYFDTSTWNGASIFRLGLNGNKMIVTPSVAGEVLKAGLVGVAVSWLDLYGIDQWNRYLETGKTPYQFSISRVKLYSFAVVEISPKNQVQKK